MWPQGTGRTCPRLRPHLGQVKQEKQYIKSTNSHEKMRDARCEKKQHLKCHGMKFLARAELSSVERAEQCEQSRAFAFVFQINFEMHK